MTASPCTFHLHGRHYATGRPIAVTMEAGRIVELASGPEEVRDWLVPAYFDLQVNGGLGIGFTSAELTAAQVREVVDLCAIHGIARFCPTVVTNASDVLRHAFAVLAEACAADAEVAQAMPLFHLEGPYISGADGARGAHPVAHVRPPDEAEFQRLQAAAGGRIGLVTLAPELPGALDFIRHRVAQGVIVSLGHTAAEPAIIREAIAAGATLSTHLGNGCPRQLPRHENLLWEQLAADELCASLITDGCHLPWNLVKCFLRMKGAERVILTADSSEMAGLPPGRYGQWAQTVDVTADGKIILVGQGVLAGSWAFLDHCVSRLVAAGVASLADAVRMAAFNPCSLLRQPLPSWEPGQAADLLLLRPAANGALELRGSLIRGRWRGEPIAAAAD